METKVSLDVLMEIVKSGGQVKTGVDVYNANGILLLAGDVFVSTLKPLEIIKQIGINSVPVNTKLHGTLLDGDGNEIRLDSVGMSEPVIISDNADAPEMDSIFPATATNELEVR